MNFETLLSLSRPPLAIGLLAAPPSGIAPWQGAVPAGCSFWSLAMSGRSFYTAAPDHRNCAIGAHTHGLTAPDGGAALHDTLGFMVSSGYLRMEEVPGIPVFANPPQYIAYAPLESAPFSPDLVLIAAKPSSAMLLYEAAVRAGAAHALTNALGRPACAVLPLTLAQQSATLSFGCKGNRTFTGLPDGELYFCVPGAKWESVAAALTSIHAANETMGRHYLQHQSRFPILA